MRIAFVSFETIHHRDSETNERVFEVLELLRDHGHDVHCLCAQWWTGTPTTFEYDDITYHGVVRSLDAGTTFLYKLPFAIRSIRPDVVHAVVDPAAQVLTARWGARLARVPLAVEWYGDDGVSDTWYDRRVATRSPVIVTPSRLVQTWLRERGASEDQLVVVPHAIDVEQIKAVEPDGTTDVAFSRRLDEDSNLESLLLGLAELRGHAVATTVFGDGPRRSDYERLASELRIDDQVTFVGNATLEERIAAYRNAHVFVQTARRCVFPTEMLWGLASGCAGIVEYHVDSSAHELVEGWERGYRTTSEEELATALLESRSLDHRNFDESFADYDRRAIANRYVDLYRQLGANTGAQS